MPSAAQLTSLDNAFATLFSGTSLSVLSAVRYLGLKVSPQNVEGQYGGDSVNAVEKLRTTPLVGAGAAGLPQATIVASLKTAMPRGLANEGRMYLPASARMPDATGRLPVQTAEQIASAVATFVSSVNAVGLGNVTVFSKTREGAARAVTGVRLGRVVDTQRRRRNQIAELYVDATTAVAPGPS
jgi:hypothetical protein